MANYVGAVRFEDGTLMYFSYYGTVDTARPALFAIESEVAHAQTDVERAAATDEEPIEVMPYFFSGNQRVQFWSRASRSAMLITGPRSVWEVDEEQRAEYRQDLIETWGRKRP